MGSQTSPRRRSAVDVALMTIAGLAVVAVVAAGVVGGLIWTETIDAPWNGDGEACRSVEVAFAQVSRDASRAGEAPSYARQSMGDVSRQLTTAAGTASSGDLVADIEYAAGYFADVENSLRQNNLFAFMRLSNEAAVVVQRVRMRCSVLEQ